MDTVPAHESLRRYYGHAVGLIYLSEYRVQLECNGYKWAGRDSVCPAISHAVKCLAPIKIKKPKGFSMQRWEIEPEEQELLRAQLPDGPPARHDLSVLDGAQGTGVTGNSSHMAPVDASGDVGPSDADMDQQAARLVAHRPADVASE